MSLVEEYAESLRSAYCDHHVFPPEQWPPKLSEVFINLALIQHDRIPDQGSLRAFVQTTLNGTVDDLCFEKYNIELDQILKPDAFLSEMNASLKQRKELYSKQLIRCLNYSAQMPDSLKKRLNIPMDDGKDLPSIEELRSVMKQPKFLHEPQLQKLLLPSQDSKPESATDTDNPKPSKVDSDLSNTKVLIDGAPGVGKTTLTWKVAQDWAKGKLFKKHELVVRVSLRDLLDEPDGVWQLLPLGSEQRRKAVEKELLDKNGKGTLLILDGWDELSFDQRKKGSLLYRLIRGDILSQCAVIVTSRPYTSRWLQLPDLVPRHVELFGFTQDQIKSCIKNEFASSPESAQCLIKLLEVRIDVLQLCYIPNNLSVIVHIFRTSKNSLPTTLTQLYELYVHSAIVRYMQTQCDDPEVPLSYDEQSSFPPDTREVYKSLCKLALWGLVQERPRMVFKDKELGDFSPLLVKEGNTLGLMTAYKSFTPYGIQRSFQFIHATIQEYLAAEALAEYSPEQQREFLLKHLSDSRFRMVLSFLAGRTGVKHLESMFRVPLSFTGHPNVDHLLLLVRMLYEAQDTKLCRVLAQNFPDNSFQLSKFVSLHMQRVSELDLYMLCHFLRYSSHAWKTIDAHDAPLSQILDAFKSSPSGVSVEELHIGRASEDDVYESLLDPAFASLKAVRAETETPLGEHARRFLASCTLTHLHFDCFNQESLEAAMSAAGKCRALEYVGLKTMPRDRDDRQKLCLSGALRFPVVRSEKFCFRCEKFEVTDDFTETLCEELATCQHFEQLVFRDCYINGHQLKLLFKSIQFNSTLQVLHVQQFPLLRWSSESEAEKAWNTETTSALKEMIENNGTLTGLWLRPCARDLAVSLGQALARNSSLASVEISSNNSISSDVHSILKGVEMSASRALQNSMPPALQVLTLQECGLRDDEMQPVAQFLSSSSCALKELDLSYNGIKQNGCDSLFVAISANTSLVTLNLDGNPLWLSKGDTLGLMLTHNSTLQELHLLSGLHLPAIEELASGFAANTTLRVLKLGVSLKSTPVEGTCMIFRALAVNTGLTQLHLAGYTMDSEGTLTAAVALQKNASLVSLYLQRCNFGSSNEAVDSLIAALYSHRALRKLALPATESAFKKIFSEYSRINRHRAENELPWLRVTDAAASFEKDTSLL